MAIQAIQALQAKQLVESIKQAALLQSLSDNDCKLFVGLSSIGHHSLAPSRIMDLELLTEALENGFITLTKPSEKDKNQNALTKLYMPGAASFTTPGSSCSSYDYLVALKMDIFHNKTVIKTELFTDFLLTVSAHECIGFLEASAKKYNFPIQVGLKAQHLFKTSLNEYNVGQLISLLWSSVKRALAMTQTGNFNRARAAGTIIPHFERLLVRAKEEQWSLIQYHRLYDIPQSRLSRIIFNDMLQISDDGYSFSEVWFRQKFLKTDESVNL